MTASLRALLANTLDYVPPADLPLDQTVRNYACYRQEPEAWMLGNFVITATELPNLEPHFEALGGPIGLCVISGGGGTMGEVLVNLQRDMATLGNFRKKAEQRARIDALDIKIQLMMPDFAPVAVKGTLQAIDRPANEGLALFFEVSSPAGYRPATTALFPTIQRTSRNGHQFVATRKTFHCQSPGFKFRCGGARAADVPSAEQLAFTIFSCCENGIPLKFTAGLRHPLRHHDDAARVKMHGFLNLVVAGVLAHARNLSEQQIQQIIEDEDPKNLVFEEDKFRWKDVSATVPEIEQARRAVVTAFSNGNFQESRDGLRALGLL